MVRAILPSMIRNAKGPVSRLSLDAFAKALHWPAPGSEDTELGVLMGPEGCHGETEVYARVQA